MRQERTISAEWARAIDGDTVPAAIAAIIVWALVPAAFGLLSVNKRDVV